MSNIAPVFAALARAQQAGKSMTPRSSSDKECFAQDWFAARLDALGLTYEQQGRNSYPDFIVGGGADAEGYEVKSLAFRNGRPARRNLDFNSTIPSGEKEGRQVFVVFFLYTGAGASPRTVPSISVAHGDLLNCDHTVADLHLNVAVHDFGSYADGFIRNRKMYVFPHPLVHDPDGLGRARLIVPGEWRVNEPALGRVGTIRRTVAAQQVTQYGIDLYARGEAQVSRRPAADAGAVRLFDVFELV